MTIVWGRSREIAAAHAKAVDERSDVGNLLLGEFEFRHCGDAVPKNVADEFAALIVQNDLGAKQIRSAVTAARIIAVTERTIDAVEHASAFDNNRVRRRALWIARRNCAASAAASRMPCPLRLRFKTNEGGNY